MTEGTTESSTIKRLQSYQNALENRATSYFASYKSVNAITRMFHTVKIPLPPQHEQNAVNQ